MPPDRKLNATKRVFLLVIVLGITVTLFYFRHEVQKLSHLGYLGIFLFSILTNASLILPLPGVIITSMMGAILNPFWVAVASGLGATLGEITGYLAGYSGQVIVDRRDWYERLTVWMKKYGYATIFVIAFVPNPMFDLAGMAAGMLKMPLARFLFWCFLGKFLKMVVFAYTGMSIFNIFVD